MYNIGNNVSNTFLFCLMQIVKSLYSLHASTLSIYYYLFSNKKPTLALRRYRLKNPMFLFSLSLMRTCTKRTHSVHYRLVDGSMISMTDSLLLPFKMKTFHSFCIRNANKNYQRYKVVKKRIVNNELCQRNNF